MAAAEHLTIFPIGHSRHPTDHFFALLAAPDPDMSVREYHRQFFAADLLRLPQHPVGARASSHGLPEDSTFFGGHHFEEAPALAALPAQDRTLFVVCLYFEVLLDQALHHFYPTEHAQYQQAGRTPKFGWYGMGPHIEHPALILSVPLKFGLVDRGLMLRLVDEGAAYFLGHAAWCFHKIRLSVSPAELLCRVVAEVRRPDDDDVGAVAYLMIDEEARGYLADL